MGTISTAGPVVAPGPAHSLPGSGLESVAAVGRGRLPRLRRAIRPPGPVAFDPVGELCATLGFARPHGTARGLRPLPCMPRAVTGRTSRGRGNAFPVQRVGKLPPGSGLGPGLLRILTH